MLVSAPSSTPGVTAFYAATRVVRNTFPLLVDGAYAFGNSMEINYELKEFVAGTDGKLVRMLAPLPQGAPALNGTLSPASALSQGSIFLDAAQMAEKFPAGSDESQVVADLIRADLVARGVLK